MSLEPLIPNRLDDENSALIVLDQTLLPGEVVYRALHTTEEICHAIKTLQVRGAPAIGVAAGYTGNSRPGSGAEHILYEYDGADRLVFSQDGVQRTSGKWTFYVYDNLNRLVQQGDADRYGGFGIRKQCKP